MTRQRGGKDSGTINVKGVYNDGTLLTCIPLSAWLNNGKVDLSYWDTLVPNQEIGEEYTNQLVTDNNDALVFNARLAGFDAGGNVLFDVRQ